MTDRKWMKKAELAEHFGVSTKTVELWVGKGMPEYRPVGGHAIYDLEEAEAWVKQNGEKKDSTDSTEK